MSDGVNIRYFVDEDKWYKYKGVKPPERKSHGITEDEIERLSREANEHKHIWKQKGNYIFCQEGALEHGKNIGVFKRLVGTNSDGTPELNNI